jgi:hypothetical protein
MSGKAVDLTFAELTALGAEASRAATERDLAAGANVVGAARSASVDSDTMLLAQVTPRRRLELIREAAAGKIARPSSITTSNSVDRPRNLTR